MGRDMSRNEINPVQVAPFHGCPRQGDMPAMYRIKCPAEEPDIHEYERNLRLAPWICTPYGTGYGNTRPA